MNGILLLGRDEVITSRAKRAGLDVIIGQAGLTPSLPFDKTLITTPGTRVPFDLLPAAWGFLERWDAAVPLWRYDVTAATAGTAAERERTAAVIRDLRVLLHAVELLFVRRNEAGEALVGAWLESLGEAGEADRQLAFLRAVYRVKPRLCVLPVSWLVESRQSRRAGTTPVHTGAAPGKGKGRPLVQVELSPGRFVKVHKGDEERARAQFERQRKGRNRNGNH